MDFLIGTGLPYVSMFTLYSGKRRRPSERQMIATVYPRRSPILLPLTPSLYIFVALPQAVRGWGRWDNTATDSHHVLWTSVLPFLKTLVPLRHGLSSESTSQFCQPPSRESQSVLWVVVVFCLFSPTLVESLTTWVFASKEMFQLWFCLQMDSIEEHFLTVCSRFHRMSPIHSLHK